MLTGAIIGAVGGLINRGVAIYENKEQAKIDQKRRSDELEAIKLNADRDTLIASYKHDTDGGVASQWVIDFLRLVRPIITFYALFSVSIFYFFVDAQGKGMIIAALLETAAMAVSWWFGSRGCKR
jgi:hypothetical protein